MPVWEEFHADDLDIRELPDGRILILGMLVGKGRSSGVEVSTPFGQIAEISDGMAIRLTGYPDHESARAAAGLAE